LEVIVAKPNTDGVGTALYRVNSEGTIVAEGVHPQSAVHIDKMSSGHFGQKECALGIHEVEHLSMASNAPADKELPQLADENISICVSGRSQSILLPMTLCSVPTPSMSLGMTRARLTETGGAAPSRPNQ
jgi:hypothetical protein